MNTPAYYIHHITTQDDRLDLISVKYFGHIGMMNDIVAANPHLPLTDSLSAGTVVNVPVYTTNQTQTNELPAWLS